MNTDINNIDPKLLEEDDRIVAYLKGQMSAEEEQQFLKDLENDPELKERAIIMARLVKGLKEVGAEQDRDFQSAFLASSEQEVETAIKDALQKEDSISSPEVAAAEASFYEQGVIAALRRSDQTTREIEVLRELTQREFEQIELIIQREFEQLRLLTHREFEDIGLLIQEEAKESRQTQTQEQAQIESIDQPKSKQKTLRGTAKWLSIAASLICIVWLGLTYNSYKNTTGLGNQYDNVIEKISRSQETEADKNLRGLFSNVMENKNIDDAIHKLSMYWEISMMDTPNDYSDHSSEIGWNLAIAHLKNNDKKEAKAVLEKLIPISEKESKVNENAILINEKAKELMEKL